MSNTDFQNGFALGMASKGKAEGKEQETFYNFNIEELTNTTIPNVNNKALDFRINNTTLNGNTALGITYIIFTALQNKATGEITKLIDVPAKYDNESPILNNSFNNFYDFTNPCVCNATLGNEPFPLSTLGEIMIDAGYCLEHRVQTTSWSHATTDYKAIGLNITLTVSFASDDIKNAIKSQLIDMVFSTNTHIGITYKKPAPIIDCGYIGG